MTVRGFVKEACIKVPGLRTEIGYKAVARERALLCLNPTGRRSQSSKSGSHGTKEVYLTPGDPVDILHLCFVNRPMGEVQRQSRIVENGLSQGVSQGRSSVDSFCNGRRSEGPNMSIEFRLYDNRTPFQKDPVQSRRERNPEAADTKKESGNRCPV